MTAVQFELVWGVKESLIRYVLQLGDGRVQAGAGGSFADGVFRLPFRDQQVTDAGRTVAFDGTILIEGHGGLLRIRLAELRVECARDTVLLTAETVDPSSELMERRPIAVLAATPPPSPSERGVWSPVEARLTQAGAETLGMLQYYPTQRVDDVSWSAPAELQHPRPVPHPLGSAAPGSA
ncbi:HtaA domain-containing protein [Herbiconiux sp. CPCC 203407]|uniref:HtaA domain-containing protein n=1 Tax=Herbiconiux oxytropis TaxID=2970915 RepID=A0AA42BT77_9MICO|nr:HtaA domain-containing protein [Herbiconiux oxytropis]MCS5720777.1 HtaA domain-containing protein [Herbiconiux oxytropis]MCS5724896.1 HtaA domain-containing protein [Herbiconiux oxytropis]